jgi:2',3'-cyclic-nucleotide 2'-phosphodiesterase / 3'-nucleotidase
MKKIFTACMLLLFVSTTIMARPRTVNLRIIETSDVHGCFYPYDFINRIPKGGSLARVCTYVEKLRKNYGHNLILLDNGDILQGQPTCYYNNFIKTDEPHVAAEMLDYMDYDAYTIGNHDVETGHAVYDRWRKELNNPFLGANVIDTKTGNPYFAPYTIIERDGVKIAIIGLLTPAIPHWLNESLWKGMKFDEMVSAARHWIEVVKQKEKPQVIIGLFHSGRNGGIATNGYNENSSLEVAQKVPGFDLILYGHDHTRHIDRIVNRQGDSVLCLDPSCEAYYVSDAQIELHLDGNKLLSKRVTGQLHDVTEENISETFMNRFHSNFDSVSVFVNRKIGTFENTIRTRDSYFGNSAFIDFIHYLQLQISGAQISFAAPLTFDTQISKGDVHICDMFNLYRYENQIYVMKLTGKEIRNYLEMSYDLWTNTMTCKDDHIMLLSTTKNDKQRNGFKNLAFNFDSASGINYTVDVTKPQGEKVCITSLSNGTSFCEDSIYHVVMNSYRGNGGGELLTKGAGIPHDSLASRVIFASQYDQRYYLIKYIEDKKILNPKPGTNWRFIPEEWAKPAIERDRNFIFKNQ